MGHCKKFTGLEIHSIAIDGLQSGVNFAYPNVFIWGFFEKSNCYGWCGVSRIDSK